MFSEWQTYVVVGCRWVTPDFNETISLKKYTTCRIKNTVKISAAATRNYLKKVFSNHYILCLVGGFRKKYPDFEFLELNHLFHPCWSGGCILVARYVVVGNWQVNTKIDLPNLYDNLIRADYILTELIQCNCWHLR